MKAAKPPTPGRVPLPGGSRLLRSIFANDRGINTNMIAKRFGFFSILFLSVAATTLAEQAQSVTQYGITWKFDKAYTVGKFVTGDCWVLGPVTVVSVDPMPGPAAADEKGEEVKSRYGVTGLVDDKRMRNGSMIVLKAGTDQGYDSRIKNYDPGLSIKFPCQLAVNRSLISTISNKDFKVPLFLDTPPASYMTKTGNIVLKTGAVLTCLDKKPPTDAFRPPYAGTEKPIYETRNIQWDLLPRLAPVKEVPPWDLFERFFERPWMTDHIFHWTTQFIGPNENEVSYGREVGRLNSTASLMLMLDVPKERKQKLMQGMVQCGIDFYGLACCGRQWLPDTAHQNGWKWPILFAGLMLGDKEMQSLPGSGKTVFQEDANYYYGKGWFGDTALYQICHHSQPRPTHEERDPATWSKEDGFCEMYRGVAASSGVGTALAVQLMKAKALWNHDAFFDYFDRWMNKPDPMAALRKSSPSTCSVLYPVWGKTGDPFSDAMWATYRKAVPAQPGGTRNLKWVWDMPENISAPSAEVPQFLRSTAECAKANKAPTLREVPDLAWSQWVVRFGACVVNGHYVPNPKPGN